MLYNHHIIIRFKWILITWGMNFYAVAFKVVFKIDLNMLCPVTEKMQIIHTLHKTRQKMVPLFINKLFMWFWNLICLHHLIYRIVASTNTCYLLFTTSDFLFFKVSNTKGQLISEQLLVSSDFSKKRTTNSFFFAFCGLSSSRLCN